jgi:hypothetical protein
LESSILNGAGLSGTGLLNAGSSTDFSGIIGTSLELAIAGIGSGNGGTAATGTLNTTGNGLNVAATNAVLAAPGVNTAGTTTPATATTTTTPTGTAAPVVAAAIPPVAVAPAAVPPTPPVPVATPTPPAATAATGTATTPPAAATPVAATGTVPAGLTPADVLQQLVADVNGRAVANLIDPGFASTSAGMFVSAAIFRASNNEAITIGTADIAGVPPAEVTAMQPARAV